MSDRFDFHRAEASPEPGLRLLAATARALRGGPGFDARPADALGGALLAQETPARMRAGALDRTLARIDALDMLDARTREAARAAGRMTDELLGLPEPLREVVLEAMATRRWQFLGRGLRRLTLHLGGEAHTEFYRITPGSGPFHHGHDGEEVTLVVSGAYHDGRARYGTGDISVMTPDDDHHPIAEPGPVCYALGVSFGRPQFHGLAGMIQKAVTRH